MLLDTHKISLIYDFWKLNNEETYLHDATELARKLTESDTIDGKLNKIFFFCFKYHLKISCS
jgi:hypothetical protein